MRNELVFTLRGIIMVGIPSSAEHAFPPLPRIIKRGVIGAAVLLLMNGAWYMVDPNEMAGVRRLGTVISPQIADTLPVIEP